MELRQRRTFFRVVELGSMGRSVWSAWRTTA
jgi:hypothetical protein